MVLTWKQDNKLLNSSAVNEYVFLNNSINLGSIFFNSMSMNDCALLAGCLLILLLKMNISNSLSIGGFFVLTKIYKMGG